MFCVFSGNSVSQFRDFLNTSPRFEELRETLPYRAGNSRVRGAAARRSQAMANYLNAADGENFDDEMPDEDNEFEGLDGGDMVVDAQAQNPEASAPAPRSSYTAALPHLTQIIPVPPSAPGISQHPFASSSHAHPVLQHLQLPSGAYIQPVVYSDTSSTAPASGNPSSSGHSHAPASMAGVSSQAGPSQAGSSSAPPQMNGASTASMHQPTQDTQTQ